jgi:alpha-L-fucosidase
LLLKPTVASFKAIGMFVVLFATATTLPVLQADRLAWWKDAKFGMFIHWGLYAIPGRAEWVMHNERIPIPEYEKLRSQFNPTKYDPEEWVKLAKEAGMKYIVITSKHHDGFCMFDSALTDYDCMSTPAKRDFIGDLVKACRKQGIKIMFYYSLIDWHHPHYVPKPDWVEDPPGHERDFNKYLEYMFGQIRELCEKYKPDGFWFDGQWEHSAEEWRAKELSEMILSILPNAVIGGHEDFLFPGDFFIFYEYVPGKCGQRLWETCMPINRNWGYHAQDNAHKSVRQLIQTLVEIASKGGNFLLNVGPMPTGEIQPEFVVRLKQMGAWLKRYGDAIFSTEPSPFLSLEPPVRGCTVKGNKLFFHFFEYPTARVEIWGLKTKVNKAYIMKDNTPVEFKQRGLKLVLDCPPIVPDPYDTIIVLELAGKPEVDLAVRQGAKGEVELSAKLAQINGRTAYVDNDSITYWSEIEDWVSWDFVLDTGGDFEVVITYSCDKGTGGSEFAVEIDGQSLEGVVEETGSWTDYVEKSLGRVSLKRGRYKLAVRALSKPGGAIMNLKAVKLLPVPRRDKFILPKGPFEPTWESLKNYQVPDWYRDAKFGIFIHWGLYSVPAFYSEWYPHSMYVKGDSAYDYHLQHYGPLTKFGYKDFIPLFKAERWDPYAWVDLFKKAGAKYIIYVAQFHDNFPMYDCPYSRWNSLRMGPKRDVVGELAKAARENGLYFGVSYHFAEHWFFFYPGKLIDSDVNDPQYADFYGPAQPEDTAPDENFLNHWLERLIHLVDTYKPSLVWFDWWFALPHVKPVFAPYIKLFAAYYYNRAHQRGEEVVINYKNDAFPEGTAVLNVCRGVLDDISPFFWQAETVVDRKSWSYIQDPDYKSAEHIIRELADAVSKNACLLLNVGPRPDGAIPEEQEEILLKIGNWLSRYGEAIYGTRPWVICKEGPTSFPAGEFGLDQEVEFTSRDIRFTQKGDYLYAIFLNEPEENQLVIESLGAGKPHSVEVKEVELLPSYEKLKWRKSEGGLFIELERKPEDKIFAIRLKIK